jgi:hypothetical protein
MNDSILVFGVCSLQKITSLPCGIEPEAAKIIRRAFINSISLITLLYDILEI